MLTEKQKKEKISLMVEMATLGLSRGNHNLLFFDSRFLRVLEARGFFDKKRTVSRGGLMTVMRELDAGVQCNNFLKIYMRISGAKLPLRRIDPFALYDTYTTYNTLFPSNAIEINHAVTLVNGLHLGKIAASRCGSTCNELFFSLSKCVRRACANCRQISKTERAVREMFEAQDKKGSSKKKVCSA